MSWIKTIPYEEAEGRLKKMYDKVKGPNNNIDNVLLIHSLRPHTLIGHMTLYKNVIHNIHNKLPKWYLEALGVYVSHLNKCSYCVDHHLEGFKKLYLDKSVSELYMGFVKDEKFDSIFDDKFSAGADYAKILTLNHSSLTESNIQKLRSVGFDDGEILELNQLVSYFNYVNRSVVGLGVDTMGDIIGLSPNNNSDPESWNHS